MPVRCRPKRKEKKERRVVTSGKALPVSPTTFTYTDVYKEKVKAQDLRVMNSGCQASQIKKKKYAQNKAKPKYLF